MLTIYNRWLRDRCSFILHDRRLTRNSFVIPSAGLKPNSQGHPYYRGYAAIRYHETWHAEPVGIIDYSPQFNVGCDGHGDRFRAIAYPVDRRMLLTDVEGATEISPNEDNTAWIFRHTKSGPHQDHELALIGALVGAFYPVILQYQVDALSGPTAEARTRGNMLLVLLASFYGDVLTAARVLARSKHLGERHKDPHPDNGHVSTEVLASIEATRAKWESTRSSDLASISAALTFVKRVTDPHDPETRWGIVERLAAAAASGLEPQNVEYIFLSQDDANEVTGAENLPDPTWNFDRPELKTGLVRGNRKYYDGLPPDLSANRAFVIRFTRVYSGTPSPNTDIGSVEWTQEAAYYAYEPPTDE